MGEYIRCADPLCEEEQNLGAIDNFFLGSLVREMLNKPSTYDRATGWRATLIDYQIKFFCPTCWLDTFGEEDRR